MLKQPFLIFSMELDDSPRLNQGRIVLYDWEEGYLGRWMATSGLGMFQKIGGYNKQGGGVCPPAYNCNPSFANYWVQVVPVDLSHVRGVEGEGYPITPFEVRTDKGVKRSDLLIHRDANVPGSMGCIVLPTDEFDDFQKTFESQCRGHEKVKLWVQYTF